jgi:hypothetical protein
MEARFDAPDGRRNFACAVVGPIVTTVPRFMERRSEEPQRSTALGTFVIPSQALLSLDLPPRLPYRTRAAAGIGSACGLGASASPYPGPPGVENENTHASISYGILAPGDKLQEMRMCRK